MTDSGLRLLNGLQVVDLLPRAFGMTGRILADLGAEVIRIDRTIEDDNVRWDRRWQRGSWAWDIGKTVVESGNEAAADLLGGARIVLRLDSAEPVGIGEVPSGAIEVVLSAFGAVGPRADWLASDLGIAAASGNLWATGDPDRPPVRCSAPLSLVHTGPEAAFAAIAALVRGTPGRVDVSMAEAFTVACLGQPVSSGLLGVRGQRTGSAIGNTREIWPCEDGWVSFGLRGGAARQSSLKRLASLAAEGGDDRLVGVDWEHYSPETAGGTLLSVVTEVFGQLFSSMTVAELERLAIEEQVLVAPILDAQAIWKSAQLVERGFFSDADGPATVPRSFGAVRLAGSEWGWLRPADGAGVADQVPTPERAAPAVLPWHGTRIIEFGSGVAGPLVGRYFAEQGATVIRVESTTRPDFLRVYALGPSNPHGLEGSPLFVWTNPGKLGVTVDLKAAGARELASALAAGAHAVIENFTPGVLERLGLGYEDLREANPELVMLSMSFHGQSGPRRFESGFGALGSALSGFNHLTGWPDREPIGPASTITDSLAPRFGAATLAAALVHQRRTGVGVHLDVAQLETAMYALSPWLASCDAGDEWGREGNRSPAAVPHGLYRCAGDDRWVAIATWSDEEWQALRGAIGWEGPALNGVENRTRAAKLIDDAVEAWTVTRESQDIAVQLQGLGVEAVPVADFGDVAADPTLMARGHFVPLDHEVLGSVFAERSGYRLDNDQGGYRRSSPFVGRDNLYVFEDVCGLSAVTVARLVDNGVIR
jgi:crotonobetainyl-CoA:carnitine CoA-transferase CaiB-like acyl-CoA transferase